MNSQGITLPPRRAHGLRGGGPSLWRGAVAGLLGGLAGSAAKMLGEAWFPPRTQGQTPPPVVLAEKVAGHPLPRNERKAAMHGIHWAFGPLAGAVYGALVEYEPQLTAKNGIAFGLGLNAMTHEKALPMLGLVAPVDEQPAQERWSEIATHALYGVVTESVRRMLRGPIERD